MRLEKKNKNPINEEKIINQIRSLGIDMINEANSGHPGMVLDAAPIIYTLFAHHLYISPENPNFFGRDRFILSSGHASALLYATLFMAGYDVELEDLKKFRQIDSITPGHPEYLKTPGVDFTTGPLGQGLASAVGIAMAEKHLSSRYNSFQKNMFNFNTYVLCGDGDLEEGISYEAISLAGSLGLNNLIVIYDSNDTTLDGKTDVNFKEDIGMRFSSCNWNYIKVDDGEDYNAISKALDDAKKTSDKPTLIEVKTVIGRYSVNEGTNLVHGKPLDAEDITQIKEQLNVRDIPFNVSMDTIEDFQYLINKRCKKLITTYEKKFNKLNTDLQEEINYFTSLDKSMDFKDLIYDKPESLKESPRDTSKKVLTSLINSKENMLIGSADLASTNGTYIEKAGDFSKENYKGKNIRFGVREHAMGAIANGLAVTGYKVFISTFLSFSNYLFPAIRLASLMKLPITYIFTHDSISIGEDGPTHQPIEQLSQLRAIPNLEVFRPCDANEVIGVYKLIMKKKSSPSVISLSKRELPILDTTNSNEIENGGYIVKKEQRKLDGVIIATGEEVHLAIEVANRLLIKGFDIRIVSMPSLSRFLEKDEEYISEILPVEVRKIVIEAGISMPWNSLVFNSKYLININEFGVSGKTNDVYKKMNFDIDSLEERVEKLLK